MDDVCSLTCPMTAGTALAATARDASRSLLRWAAVGAASAILFVLAMIQGGSVGAAAPTTYDNPVCINYTTCYPTGAPTTTTTTTNGLPGNAVVSTYVDPRYCNGLVSVVTDSNGTLIDVCTATGQRIYPVFPDYGFGAGFVGSNFIGSNFVGANFINGTYLAPGTANGITCNGVYGCPFGGGFIGNGNFNNGFNGINANFVNGFNGFNGGAFNGNTFPAGATFAGGNTFLYNDNRFCTEGKLAFVQNRGYFCQNGGPLVTNNATTTVNCGNFFLNGCGIYRPFEANTAAPASPQQTTPVTTYAVAPKAAAPVVQAAAPVVQAAAPVTQQAAPVVAKAQTAPVAATPTPNKPAGSKQGENGRDA